MRVLRFAIVAVLVVAGCATNPATGRRQLILMSEAEEIQLGRQGDEDVRRQMGIYDDPALQEYVNRIGQRLAQASERPNLPWTFRVVDQQAVNAFALPGGFIYITRGILPYLRDESELAAVLGHEVGHVDGKHSVDAISRQQLAGVGLALGTVFAPEEAGGLIQGLGGAGLGLLFLQHGRQAELESDQLGVRYASANGWAPSGMPGLLSTLDRLDQANGSTRGVPNWALTHPRAADRVQQVQQFVAAAPASATTRNREELERHIDGIVYGDSREQGMVRNGEFVHPVLRFGWTFPSGWDVQNSAEQVVSVPDANSAVGMVLQLAPEASGSVGQTAGQTMSSAGYQEREGGATRINGLDAYVGTYTRTSQSGQQTVVRAAHIRVNGQTYIVAGVASPDQFNGARDTFDRSIGSVRELSTGEANGIQPDRIDFYTVRPGESWSSIAAGPSDGQVSATTLAIMNGYQPTDGPRAGERIRIVVGG